MGNKPNNGIRAKTDSSDKLYTSSGSRVKYVPYSRESFTQGGEDSDHMSVFLSDEKYHVKNANEGHVCHPGCECGGEVEIEIVEDNDPNKIMKCGKGGKILYIHYKKPPQQGGADDSSSSSSSLNSSTDRAILRGVDMATTEDFQETGRDMLSTDDNGRDVLMTDEIDSEEIYRLQNRIYGSLEDESSDDYYGEMVEETDEFLTPAGMDMDKYQVARGGESRFPSKKLLETEYLEEIEDEDVYTESASRSASSLDTDREDDMDKSRFDDFVDDLVDPEITAPEDDTEDVTFEEVARIGGQSKIPIRRNRKYTN